jgi:hypothetical protein
MVFDLLLSVYNVVVNQFKDIFQDKKNWQQILPTIRFISCFLSLLKWLQPKVFCLLLPFFQMNPCFLSIYLSEADA